MSRKSQSRRYDTDERGVTEYHCNMCGENIGKSVQFADKYDRVYCSRECRLKAFDHPSRDYEWRGDY